MLLLVTWILIFFLLAVPIAAANAWLLRVGETDLRVLVAGPLVFAGVVAGAAFVAYFIHPIVGHLFSVGILTWLGGDLGWRWHRQKSPPVFSGIALPALLAFAIGLFYLGLLYLPDFNREPEWQSSVRFLYEFPVDANLPKILGDRVYDGVSPKPFLPEAGWLSSDRPPLQSGFYLLVRPWLGILGCPPGLIYQCAATFAQLFWIPGVWLICRISRLDYRQSTIVILMIAASGFALFNSTYVWPKLLAGGFVLLSASLLLDRTEARTDLTTILGGAAAALGWLAHGGVAFSLVVLALILLVPPWYLGRNRCVLGVASFMILALPWFAYQNFYDPPANRLLKWHLAGVIPVDARSTWEAIHDSYAALPRDTLVANKVANYLTLFHGSFGDALNIFTTSLQKRRVDEFFNVFRSLGILNLAWIIAPVMWMVRRRVPPFFELQGLLAGWTLVTLLLWATLMFIPASTLLHQGSYAAMLSLFLLAVVFLLQAPRWLGLPVLAWHVVEFSVTWLPYTKSAPMNFFMFIVMASAVALLVLAVRRAEAFGDGRWMGHDPGDEPWSA